MQNASYYDSNGRHKRALSPAPRFPSLTESSCAHLHFDSGGAELELAGGRDGRPGVALHVRPARLIFMGGGWGGGGIHRSPTQGPTCARVWPDAGIKHIYLRAPKEVLCLQISCDTRFEWLQ